MANGQDNLTVQFQRRLQDQHGVAASLTELENILRDQGIDPESPNIPVSTAPAAPAMPDKGGLWGAMQTGTGLPDWFDEGDDFRYQTSLGSLVGKSVWSFLETAAIGIPGLIARGIDKDWERSMRPVSTAERWTTAITGVAGFIPPFGVARGVASAALKGARVTKGGKVVGYGAEAASAKLSLIHI